MSMEGAEAHNDNLLLLQHYEGPCPNCEFLLKSPTSNRCPECGATLKVMLAKRFRLSGWLLVFVGLTASIVIVANFLVFRLVGWYSSNAGVPWRHLNLLLAMLVILAPCYLVWISLRPWIQTRGRFLRFFIGSLGILLPFGVFQGVIWISYAM